MPDVRADRIKEAEKGWKKLGKGEKGTKLILRSPARSILVVDADRSSRLNGIIVGFVTIQTGKTH